MDITKDTLLRKADALLAEARRARKLSAAEPPGAASDRLMRDAEALEGRAARLEKDAASAKNGVFSGPRGPAGARDGAAARAERAFRPPSHETADGNSLASGTRARPRASRAE